VVKVASLAADVSSVKWTPPTKSTDVSAPWTVRYLAEPTTALVRHLDLGERADLASRDCRRVVTGIETAFRSEVPDRWSGWPRHLRTDGCAAQVCCRTGKNTITVAGLMLIEGTASAFAFRADIERIGPVDARCSLYVAGLDPRTGHPPHWRMDSTVIHDLHAPVRDQWWIEIADRRRRADWGLIAIIDTAEHHVESPDR
jgi:hypothetical protein